MDSVGNIILYFVVAIVMVISAYLAVTTTKILRAATYLLFSLICTAVFYFQLGYQFLGAVQIAVYAGGIMVLFVFAIILTHKPNEKSAPLLAHRKFTGIAASVVGAALLLVAPLQDASREGYLPLAGHRLRRSAADHARHRHRSRGFGEIPVSSSFRGCQRPAARLHHRWSCNRT